MVAHRVARDQLAGVVGWRRPNGREGPTIGNVLDAALEAAGRTAPLAALLVEVPEEVRPRLGQHDGLEQLKRGAPSTTATRRPHGVQDVGGRPVGQQHVHPGRDLAEDASASAGRLPGIQGVLVSARLADAVGPAVLLPRAPGRAEEPQTFEHGLLLVKHTAVPELSLHVPRSRSSLRVELARLDATQRVPPVMVARNDDDVLVAGTNLPQPRVEVGNLRFGPVVGKVARVHKDVTVRQRETRFDVSVHRVRVAEVHDSNLALWQWGRHRLRAAASSVEHRTYVPADVRCVARGVLSDHVCDVPARAPERQLAAVRVKKRPVPRVDDIERARLVGTVQNPPADVPSMLRCIPRNSLRHPPASIIPDREVCAVRVQECLVPVVDNVEGVRLVGAVQKPPADVPSSRGPVLCDSSLHVLVLADPQPHLLPVRIHKLLPLDVYDVVGLTRAEHGLCWAKP
mmetsp:Transcript_104980/g.313637  ORF Transcript_104980/g.313637 Transcript_104980/m.313637 type:complete len:457 (-) Transcript_104980:23-1393(-)